MDIRHKRGAATKLGISVEEYEIRVCAGEKWCSGCRAWHPVSDFGKSASRYDGLNSSCKEFTRKSSIERYVPHPKLTLTSAEAEEHKTLSSRRRMARKHLEKWGPGAGDMRGRHGNNLTGSRHPRWNNGRMRTSHGYVAVKVPEGHHLRQAHGYAYEHDLVAEQMLGRRLLLNEVVHHKNGVRDDNRPENLSVETRGAHAKEHVSVPGARDPKTGRFVPGAEGSRCAADLRVRELGWR